MNSTTKHTKKPASIVKSGLSLSILTLFSRILGLVREMVKSRFLGTSPLADAFTVSFLIPNLLRRLFAENSMTVAFIPTFKELLEKNEDERQKNEEMKDFLSSIFTIVSFFTTIVVMLGIIFTPYILKVLFPKLEDGVSAIFLTRIMFPYLFFISLAAFFQGILNGVKIFSPSGFTPILFNISVIGCTYAFSGKTSNPAVAMSIGVIIGGFLQASFQAPYVMRQKFKFAPCSLIKAFKNNYTKKTLRLIGPTIIGMAAYQINDLVSTSLATAYGTGIASSLQYSLRLQELLLGVFVVSISSVILPDLSAYAIKKEWKSFENLFLQSIKVIALITIPASFFAFCSGKEIVSIIYRRASFDSSSVALTVLAFNCHIVGLFFIALNRVIAPAFYAMQDSDSPTIAGISSFVVNIFFALILVKWWLGGGIALALSIASIANTLLLFALLRKKQVLNIKKISTETLVFSMKIAIFSSIASIPSYMYTTKLENFLINSCHLNLILSYIVALLILFSIFSTICITFLLLSKDAIALLLLKKIKSIFCKFYKRRGNNEC